MLKKYDTGNLCEGLYFSGHVHSVLRQYRKGWKHQRLNTTLQIGCGEELHLEPAVRAHHCPTHPLLQPVRAPPLQRVQAHA